MPHKWGEWVDFKERAASHKAGLPGLHFIDHDFMVTRNNSHTPIRWLWANNYDANPYPMQYMLWVEGSQWGEPE